MEIQEVDEIDLSAIDNIKKAEKALYMAASSLSRAAVDLWPAEQSLRDAIEDLEMYKLATLRKSSEPTIANNNSANAKDLLGAGPLGGWQIGTLNIFSTSRSENSLTASTITVPRQFSEMFCSAPSIERLRLS